MIGSVIFDPDCLPAVKDVLAESDFYKSAFRKIYRAAKAVLEQDGIADLVTICEKLKVDGDLESVGGYSYVASLDQYQAIDNFENKANKLKNYSVLRDTINMTIEAQRQAEKGQDAGEILSAMSRQATVLESKLNGKNTFHSMRQMTETMTSSLEDLHRNAYKITGITTGYPYFDKLTAGLQPTDLIVIAARPSMGKTALAVNLMANQAMRGAPVGLLSLEQGWQQIYNRLISNRSSVNSHKFRIGNFTPDDWQAITHAQSTVYNWPIWIDDSSGLHYVEIRRRARLLHKKHGIKCLYIDYLQLIQGDKQGGRVQEIGTITRALKALAKELSIPIVVLSQLSRALEQRDDKRPRLSDLRDSGEIEQDADLVAFLYRPFVYDETSDPTEAELNIAKQRNGPTGRLKLVWNEKTMTFYQFIVEGGAQ